MAMFHSFTAFQAARSAWTSSTATISSDPPVTPIQSSPTLKTQPGTTIPSKQAIAQPWPVRHELTSIAKHILQQVAAQFSTIEAYYTATFGAAIRTTQVHDYLQGYFRAHGISGHVSIVETPDIKSGGMLRIVPSKRGAEHRKFVLHLYNPAAPSKRPSIAAGPAEASSDATPSVGSSSSSSSRGMSDPASVPSDSGSSSSSTSLPSSASSASMPAAVSIRTDSTASSCSQPDPSCDGPSCSPEMSSSASSEPGTSVCTATASSLPDGDMLSAGLLHREIGLRCFANHELGTHAMRGMNEGHQLWASKRSTFGLHKLRSRASIAGEEGLASVNSQYEAGTPWLWAPALLYYAATLAERMNIFQLYDALGEYFDESPSAQFIRYRMAARAKLGIHDPLALGGSGNCQVYLEGAAELLGSLHSVNLAVLYCGHLTVGEAASARVLRVARSTTTMMPTFVRKAAQYKARLLVIAEANGIPVLPPPPAPAPAPAKTPAGTAAPRAAPVPTTTRPALQRPSTAVPMRACTPSSNSSSGGTWRNSGGARLAPFAGSRTPGRKLPPTSRAAGASSTPLSPKITTTTTANSKARRERSRSACARPRRRAVPVGMYQLVLPAVQVGAVLSGNMPRAKPRAQLFPALNTRASAVLHSPARTATLPLM